jgi:hypothetical protein
VSGERSGGQAVRRSGGQAEASTSESLRAGAAREAIPSLREPESPAVPLVGDLSFINVEESRTDEAYLEEMVSAAVVECTPATGRALFQIPHTSAQFPSGLCLQIPIQLA